MRTQYKLQPFENKGRGGFHKKLRRLRFSFSCNRNHNSRRIELCLEGGFLRLRRLEMPLLHMPVTTNVFGDLCELNGQRLIVWR